MTTPSQGVAVVIPASNEAKFLPRCLGALLKSEQPHMGVEIIVASNGSTDGTADMARTFQEAITERGWILRVLDLPEGSKIRALNAGDQASRGAIRVYLDADVTISPRLLAGLARVLDRPDPAYASGRLSIRATGGASRAYARLWSNVPFMSHGVPGCGLYAVNGPGRARWGDWPAIIADDLFARLHFAPRERHLVPELYFWPIAEGFSALVRVRRRQDRGVREIATRFPDLLLNEDKPPLDSRALGSLYCRDPLGFMVYAGVSLSVRAPHGDRTWSRGR